MTPSGPFEIGGPTQSWWSYTLYWDAAGEEIELEEMRPGEDAWDPHYTGTAESRDMVKFCVLRNRNCGASFRGFSGGGHLHFSVHELDALDHLGDQCVAIESSPLLLGFDGELEDHRHRGAA